MRVIDQATMNQLFAVTDDLDFDREKLTVPLVQSGEGQVAKLANGKIEITLPDTDDLAPFLAALPERLSGLLQ
jgi:hypothetical protein